MFERGKIGEIGFNYIYNSTPSTFPKEFLQKIYDECYVFNLINIIKESSYFDIHFENINELESIEHVQSSDFTIKSNNSYLKSCINKEELARDIMKNGMYWHFFGYKKDGKKYVNAGAHRLISAQLLNKMGEWPDNKKVMVIFTKDPINANLKTFCSLGIKLNNVKTIRIPIWLIEPNFDLATDTIKLREIEKRYESRNLRFLNNYIVEVEAYTVDHLMYGVDTLSIWCRELLFKQNLTGDVIESSNIVNSEIDFENLKSNLKNNELYTKVLNGHSEDEYVINKIISMGDKLERPIFIAEFAGKDSIAAIIHTIMNDDKPKTILPIASFSLNEYGNINSINQCYDFLLRDVKQLNKDVEILPLFYYTDTNLYRLIKDELRGIAKDIKNQYDIPIDCIICHFYLHLLRAKFAKNTLNKTIITGERSFHDSKIKVNQNDVILDMYKNVFLKKNVKLSQPIRNIQDTKVIDNLIGKEFVRQITHIKCDYSKIGKSNNMEFLKSSSLMNELQLLLEIIIQKVL